MKLLTVIAELGKGCTFAATPISTIPPRYDFGDPMNWHVAISYRCEHFTCYFHAGSRDATISFQDVIASIIAECHILQEFKNVSAWIEEKGVDESWTHNQYVDFEREERRSWSISVENRAQFKRVFGENWYRRLMHAEYNL